MRGVTVIAWGSEVLEETELEEDEKELEEDAFGVITEFVWILPDELREVVWERLCEEFERVELVEATE